jgi:hypothetical protein
MNRKSIPKINELRPICQPSYKFEETLFLVYIIRHFSIYITRIFLFARISANQTSALSLLFGLVGCLFLIKMLPWYIFIGSISLIIHTLLDFVDGEVARYSNKGTLTGKYLDDVNHSITVPMLLFCTSFGLYGVIDNIWIFFFGSLAAICEAVGHNVDWGYPNRILYSELKNSIIKYKRSENTEIEYYEIKTNEKSVMERIAWFFTKIHSLISKVNIIKKLYDKLWFENRIVNFVILVGIIAPLLSYYQYSYLYIEVFSIIILIYGVNRPIVLLQRYLGNIIFKNETIEYEMNIALKKLEEF